MGWEDGGGKVGGGGGGASFHSKRAVCEGRGGCLGTTAALELGLHCTAFRSDVVVEIAVSHLVDEERDFTSLTTGQPRRPHRKYASGLTLVQNMTAS